MFKPYLYLLNLFPTSPFLKSSTRWDGGILLSPCYLFTCWLFVLNLDSDLSLPLVHSYFYSQGSKTALLCLGLLPPVALWPLFEGGWCCVTYLSSLKCCLSHSHPMHAIMSNLWIPWKSPKSLIYTGEKKLF